MNDTLVTFHGWVGGDVRQRLHKDVPVATIRVAVTPRLKRDGEWVDGETVWYAVTAWRTLAEHVTQSVRKGDAVIVHGRIRGAEAWLPEQGPPSTTVNVEAMLVGHDLTRGRSQFVRDTRPRRPETADADAGSGAHGDGPTADPSGPATPPTDWAAA